MNEILCRAAEMQDIPALAALRSIEWGDQPYWELRIAGYMSSDHNPQQALPPRTVIVAKIESTIIGFIAGHLTTRYECDGELEWINVLPDHRGQSISAELLRNLWNWFLQNDAHKICVNVTPDNPAATRFYAKYGAVSLNAYWMIWQDIRQTSLT
jgi:ribosomal protein S18 acetylase RimI-like enzyme